VAITFKRAPVVTPGDPITSTQMVGLAEAANSRIRSGIADPVFRVAFYMMGLFRQIRNSDGAFSFPSQAEFFEAYQPLETGDAQWPPNFAGLPEGINVANPMGAFVFGRDSEDIAAEVDRIEGVPFSLPATPTPSDYWHLAKLQRGALDPKTGAVASPVFSAAREHMRIAYSVRAPYGNSYGGFLPIPELGGFNCAPSGDITPVNYLYKFTNLSTGEEVAYPGSCPEEPTHVAYILRLGDVYVVVLNNGGVDVYAANEWIEGPYTGGGSLRRDVGEQLARSVDRYVKDFRGTAAQRETGRWNENAFDFQTFLTRQYLCAPNRGEQVGDNITVTYPQFRIKGPVGSGVQSNAHSYFRGWVCTGALFTSEGVVTQSVDIEWLDSKTVVHRSTLEPVGGKIEQVVMLPFDLAPEALRFRLASGFTGTLLTVEATELYPYKPQAHDAYLFLRVSSARSGEIPGSGLITDNAREIGEQYFRSGAIVPGPGLPLEESIISTNAVFDAARRMSQCVRILTRDHILAYAVEDGKSILWVRTGNRINRNGFIGIAPPGDPVASGSILENVQYSCREGEVWYNGVKYAAGDPFTGIKGVSTYAGNTVYQHDSILHDAPPEGYSNEWVIDFQFKPYNLSESSIWKPSAYSDYYAFSNRCHFYHQAMNPWNAPIQQQFNYGSSIAYAPEAASGYNYVNGTNTILCDPLDTACEDERLARYKSCRVYEPPVEIESATNDTLNGFPCLKLTFTGRFHHSDTAPSSITNDVTTWDGATIEAEGYRTTENAIRQYIIWANTGRNTPLAVGDYAVGSQILLATDMPFGAIFPHIFLLQLIPKPYEDGNDKQDRRDTPLFHDTLSQVELYLRAMCEGYVDGRTSEEYACQSGIAGNYDYSFPNLMFDATSGKWASSLGWTESDWLASDEIRADRPQGFGPYPNTLAASQVFNQLSQGFNLLTKVRVALPFKLEAQTLQDVFTNPAGVAAKQGDGDPADCSAGETNFYYVGGVPDGEATTVTVPWFDNTGANGTVAVAFASNPSYLTHCIGSNYGIGTTRRTDEYQYSLVDPDAENAIPEAWRDMIDTDGEQLFTVTTLTRSRTIRIVPLGGGTVCEGAQPWVVVPGSTVLEFVDDEVIEETCEILPATGEVVAPSLGTAIIAGGNVLGTECSSLPVSSQENSRTIQRVPEDGITLNVPLE
jgi:hypothetical protein